MQAPVEPLGLQAATTPEATERNGTAPTGLAEAVVAMMEQPSRPEAGATTAAALGTTTMKIRAGAVSAGTTTLNGAGAARKYGGVLASYLRIREIMA